MLCYCIHLARCFDPFPDAEVHNGEDEQQAEGQLPANAPQVLQPIGPVHLQNLAAAGGKKNTAEILLNQMLTLNVHLTVPYCGLSIIRNFEILISSLQSHDILDSFYFT